MEPAREQLAAMPLHAITAVYGEDGLRARFALEKAKFDLAERCRLERALALASRVHAADRRAQEPYVNHLLRVAIRIICYYGVRDADVVCAALLHDAVEDHPAELAAERGAQLGEPAAGGAGPDASAQRDALAALAAGFGSRVADLVAAVTNPASSPGQDKNEQYREHVAASLASSPWARVIKASDFTDNGVGLIYTTGPRAARLAAKYAPLVPVLRELIARPDTPLNSSAKEHILGQLDRAAERFTAIGPPG